MDWRWIKLSWLQSRRRALSKIQKRGVHARGSELVSDEALHYPWEVCNEIELLKLRYHRFLQWPVSRTNDWNLTWCWMSVPYFDAFFSVVAMNGLYSPPTWTQEAYRPRRTTVSFLWGWGGGATLILSGGGGGYPYLLSRCTPPLSSPGMELEPETGYHLPRPMWTDRQGMWLKKLR